MKKILTVLVLAMMFSSALQAQSKDKERLDRDLKIAENVLATLLGDDDNRFHFGFGNQGVEGSYEEGYGVIFSIPNRYHQGLVSVSKLKKSDKGTMSYSYNESDEDDSGEDIKEAATTFFTDYANLIGQLASDEYIMIKTTTKSGNVFLWDGQGVSQGRNNNAFVVSNSKRKSRSSTSSYEANVKDIVAYQKGSISKEELVKRIVITESDIDHSKYADLEMLASMFQRLYKQDLSDTYYTNYSNISYEKLKNVGAIFRMKVYSSSSHKDLYYMPTIAEDNLSLEERNEEVLKLLPKFEKSFKENIISYGRTVKNLTDQEQIKFEVRMTECSGCKDFPDVMKFSVPMSVLNQYNKGSLSLEQALDRVKVVKK